MSTKETIKNPTWISKICFSESEKQFRSLKYIHLGGKRVNLLPAIPKQMSIHDIRGVLCPKLGQRYQAVLEDSYQLKLICNIRKDTVIKAVLNTNFLLPNVLIAKAVSPVFTHNMLSSNVKDFSKFRKKGLTSASFRENVELLIQCQGETRESVLSLCVESADINIIRRAWPVLWPRWKQVILWTHQTERYQYYPPIKTIEIPFLHEIDELKRRCKFPQFCDRKSAEMLDLAIILYLLTESIPTKPRKRFHLATVKKLIERDFQSASSLRMLSRLCGFSNLAKACIGTRKEIGLIVNYIRQEITLTEYIALRCSANFDFNGKTTNLKLHGALTNPEKHTLKILQNVEKLGYIRVCTKKNVNGLVVFPQIPNSLYEVLSVFFTSGDIECIQVLKQHIKKDNGKMILQYMSDIYNKQRVLESDEKQADQNFSFFVIENQEIFAELTNSQNLTRVATDFNINNITSPKKLVLENMDYLSTVEMTAKFEKIAAKHSSRTNGCISLCKINTSNNSVNTRGNTKIHELTKQSAPCLADHSKLCLQDCNRRCLDFVNNILWDGLSDESDLEASQDILCEICGYMISGSDITAHVVSSDSHSNFNLGAPSTSKGSLPSSDLQFNDHISHSNSDSELICSYCDKIFLRRDKRKLELHVRIHTGEGPFACEQCAKRFHGKRNLTLHMNTHVEQRVSCPHCSNTYKSTKYLQRHNMKTHNKNRDL